MIASAARACATAVGNVNGEIADALVGLEALDQRGIDTTLDRPRRHRQQGPPRRQRDPRRLASPWPRPRPTSSSLPLYRYVGGANAHVLPVPMMNVLNGGVHADNNVDFQEFMIMPVGAASLHRGRCAGASRPTTR